MADVRKALEQVAFRLDIVLNEDRNHGHKQYIDALITEAADVARRGLKSPAPDTTADVKGEREAIKALDLAAEFEFYRPEEDEVGIKRAPLLTAEEFDVVIAALRSAAPKP